MEGKRRYRSIVPDETKDTKAALGRGEIESNTRDTPRNWIEKRREDGRGKESTSGVKRRNEHL